MESLWHEGHAKTLRRVGASRTAGETEDGTARRTIPIRGTETDERGAVRSVQAAELRLPAQRLDEIWTPMHLDFVVPQIDPILARATMAGARLEGEVETHVWGRIAVLADPFGHGFCLIEFLGRGYDEIAS